MRYVYILLALTFLWSCNYTHEKVIKEIIETSSGSNTRFIQKFDEGGNLIHSEHDYDRYGPSDEIRKYHYVEDRLMKMEWFFRNGKQTSLYMTDYYTYNPDSTIHSRIRKDSDDDLYWEFKYNHRVVNGQKELTIDQYDNFGELIQKWLYKYDSMGRIIEEPSEYDGSIMGSLTYQYYDNDLVQITELNINGENEQMESYKIDNKGNFIKYNDGTKYNWKYDKYGNWIEKETINEIDRWSRYRHIEYF